jgi:WD40 repeat protein
VRAVRSDPVIAAQDTQREPGKDRQSLTQRILDSLARKYRFPSQRIPAQDATYTYREAPLHRSAYLFGSLLFLAACGANGDDDVVDPPDAVALDDCADGTAPLTNLWTVDNLHGEIISMSPVAPDGTIVLGTADGAVKQWALGATPDTAPLPGGRPSYGEPFTESGQPARALTLGVSGDRVLAGDDGVGLHAWAIPDAAELGALLLKGSPFTAIAARSDTEVVVADSEFSGQMRVVDLEGGIGSGVFETTLWNVTSMAASGGMLFAAGHDYGMAALERRDLASPEVATDSWDTLQVEGWIRSVAVSPDRAWVATGGDGHVLVLATDDLAAGPVAQLALTAPKALISARGVAFTPSGQRIAVVRDDGRLELYAPELGAPVATIDVPQPVGVMVDRTGDRLIVASGDGNLRAFGCTP